MDQHTRMKWSFFLKKKSDLQTAILPFLQELRERDNKPIKFVRCDNAGENKALECACLDKALGLTFEYTAPGTPQQNGRVERAFATLYGRVRTMLNAAMIPKDLRNKIWAECANTATRLDTAMAEDAEKKSPYFLFYNQHPAFLQHLRTFGEIGIVTDHTNKKIRGKLEDRGFPCMFMGYTTNHAGNVYCMLNLRTE